MHRGLETLCVAYVVVASLYGGAMYVASNESLEGDVTRLPAYAYDAAREQFPEADRWIADTTTRTQNHVVALLDKAPANRAYNRHIQRWTAVSDTRTQISGSIPTVPPAVAATDLEEMVAEALPVIVAENRNARAANGASQFSGADVEISEEYFAPIAAAQLTQRVEARLRDNLASEHYLSFDLFIYVSKAGSGPWAQQMYVFEKQGGALDLLHSWPVSTGREGNERTPSGAATNTTTPAGYFQFDAGRMFRNYRSVQWDAPMPNAMFFNWVNRGRLTGIAIHGVLGRPVASLGGRASAGCVRLSPETAEVLFDLVRGNFQGRVARFDYDERTSSLSRDGVLARDEDGALRYIDGYRALVFIDTYGGEDTSAIF